MIKHLIYIVFFSFATFSYAQTTSVVQHKVQKGENILLISKKYNVTPQDIFKLNPDAQKNLEENTILLIPKLVKSNNIAKNHTVLAKETLYSISKLYDIYVTDLEKENSDVLREGLKVGLVLIIPSKENNLKDAIYHEVKPKETKYSIAKLYNITVEEIEKQNPEVITDLPVGFKLLIIKNKALSIKSNVVKISKPTESLYTIKVKETLYGISRQFEVTQEELMVLNPELKEGLKDGMIIKIPLKSSSHDIKKVYKDLTKSSVQGTNKKLAILLPFNLNKIDQDTINTTKIRLKKDKFLNMTLDFYAGALMAIDSVKKMGLNVEVTILDSNETKSTSSVGELIQQNNLKSMNAIIGPFYQNNIEKMVELVSQSNIPIFSPLSKDYDKKYDNLIQTIPLLEDVRNSMFDFMKSKNGNVIAIIDPKKAALKQYVSENQKDVYLLEFLEKGILNFEILKAKLVKGKTNFIVMETEKTNQILSITKFLVSLLPVYDIKLVVLGENAALDYEEIPIENLVKLKMHYPSMTRKNYSNEALFFENNFKKKNKIAPNLFAKRGFDITFDVVLRLSQESSIMETLNESATEQIESKFYYKQNPEGGFINKGVYIVYYDTDYTIKEAK